MSKLKDAYLMWHSFLPRMPRFTRYTLGVKLDNSFLDLISLTLTAQYTKKEQKPFVLSKISERLDYLKYFMTILWEAKGIDASKCTQISQKLELIGRMLGKWIQSAAHIKTPE